MDCSDNGYICTLFYTGNMRRFGGMALTGARPEGNGGRAGRDSSCAPKQTSHNLSLRASVRHTARTNHSDLKGTLEGGRRKSWRRGSDTRTGDLSSEDDVTCAASWPVEGSRRWSFDVRNHFLGKRGAVTYCCPIVCLLVCVSG